MVYLFLLFFISQLAILARYLVFHAFEPVSFGASFLFLVGGCFIAIYSKIVAKKEVNYKARDINGWSFANKQKLIFNKKPLFFGERNIGYILRFFDKKWKKYFSDIVDSSFYLNLEVKIDSNVFRVLEQNTKIFSNKRSWIIYKNSKCCGTIKTDFDLKNSMKLTEDLKLN